MATHSLFSVLGDFLKGRVGFGELKQAWREHLRWLMQLSKADLADIEVRLCGKCGGVLQEVGVTLLCPKCGPVCVDCGTPYQSEADGSMYCPNCAFRHGQLCSYCYQDGGNGAGGYSNCHGVTLCGALGSGAPRELPWPPYLHLHVEILSALVLGTFARHPVPLDGVLEPVLSQLTALGWSWETVRAEETLIDGRSEVDFSQPHYLRDAIERALRGLRTASFSKFHVVVINVTGFNPTALILAAEVGAFQEEAAITGFPFSPEFWAAHYDRETQKYQAYEIGPHNYLLRGQYMKFPKQWGLIE